LAGAHFNQNQVPVELFTLIILIILSGVSSAAEIALVSLSPAKVRTMEGDHKFASKIIVHLKGRAQRVLITILVANNLVNILSSVVATLWAVRVWGDHAVGAVTGAMTFIILMFGEICPKTFAQRYAEGFSRLLAYPTLVLTWILFPIAWFFEKFINWLTHLVGAHHTAKTFSSDDEFLALLDIGTEEGVIEAQEQQLIENVLEFGDTTVEEIMTSVKDIEAMPATTTIKEAVDFFIKYAHSRIPVYKETVNNIVGIITVRELIRYIKKRSIKTLEDIKFTPPIVVPKTMAIRKLFRQFQHKHQHIAIVVDEHGATIGLLTMEDILEEIVGDISDEHDKEEKNIISIEKNLWEADADVKIEDVNKILKLQLDYPEHQTIALLILEKLERFPKLDEKIQFENVIFQVKAMSKKKIETVWISKTKKHELVS
jgi:CBS domain containing-hemolysin-like protein